MEEISIFANNTFMGYLDIDDLTSDHLMPLARQFLPKNTNLKKETFCPKHKFVTFVYERLL